MPSPPAAATDTSFHASRRGIFKLLRILTCRRSLSWSSSSRAPSRTLSRLERARQELTLLKKDSEVEHLKSSAVNAKEFDLKRSHYFELEAMYRSITIVMAPGLMQCLWVS